MAHCSLKTKRRQSHESLFHQNNKIGAFILFIHIQNQKADYSESLILNYTDTDNNVQQEILETSRSMLSNWMEILDYDTENKETLEKTFDLLLSSVHLFGILDIQKDNLETDIDIFIKKFENSAFSDTASSVLDILKECFDPHPVLAYLYPHYYALLHLLYLYAKKSCSYEEIKPQFAPKYQLSYKTATLKIFL